MNTRDLYRLAIRQFRIACRLRSAAGDVANGQSVVAAYVTAVAMVRKLTGSWEVPTPPGHHYGGQFRRPPGWRGQAGKLWVNRGMTNFCRQTRVPPPPAARPCFLRFAFEPLQAASPEHSVSDAVAAYCDVVTELHRFGQITSATVHLPDRDGDPLDVPALELRHDGERVMVNQA